jgi:hypothetical protein
MKINGRRERKMEKIWSNKFARASGTDKRVMFPGAQS